MKKEKGKKAPPRHTDRERMNLINATLLSGEIRRRDITGEAYRLACFSVPISKKLRDVLDRQLDNINGVTP